MNKEKTEQEVITEAVKRLGLFMEYYSSKKLLCINTYYNIEISFDDVGKIIRISSHP